MMFVLIMFESFIFIYLLIISRVILSEFYWLKIYFLNLINLIYKNKMKKHFYFYFCFYKGHKLLSFKQIKSFSRKTLFGSEIIIPVLDK